MPTARKSNQLNPNNFSTNIIGHHADPQSHVGSPSPSHVGMNVHPHLHPTPRGRACQRRRQHTSGDNGDASLRRVRKQNEQQRNMHVVSTLLSVSGLTPGCASNLPLTQYQRLSQLVRYVAFLEDAAFCLVKELGVRLNFDFSPVTRNIRRLRYQLANEPDSLEFQASETDELQKLLETMSAGKEPLSASCQPVPAATPGHGWPSQRRGAGCIPSGSVCQGRSGAAGNTASSQPPARSMVTPVARFAAGRSSGAGATAAPR